MKKIISFQEDNVDYSRVIDITLRLSSVCNFKCNYCSQYDNDTKPTEYENLKIILEKFISNLKNLDFYDKVNWYIHGGEPTMYPKFIQIMLDMDSFHKQVNLDYEIEVQTNASYKNLDKFQLLKDINISFLCSYQNHQNNPIQYKKFVSNLLELNMLSCVDIMLENFGTENEYYNINNIYEWVKEKRIESNKKFGIQCNAIDGSDNDLPDTYNKFLTDSNFAEKYNIKYNDGSEEILDRTTVVINGINDFKFFRCNAGKNNLIIDTMDKEEIKIYKCFSDIIYQKAYPIYKFKFSENIDTNIKSILKLLKPTLCIHPKCVCELQIPKKRIKYGNM